MQCDGYKPQCQRCKKSRLQCTGYDIYREQRELVWKTDRAPGKSNVDISKRTFMPSASTVAAIDICLPNPLHHGIAECREQQAVFFYFGQIQPRLQGYWTDELSRLYLEASPSSILAKMVVALSSSLTSVHPRFSHFKPLAMKRYAECLRLVRKALKNPMTAMRDDILIAVILLGTYEVCYAENLDELFIR